MDGAYEYKDIFARFKNYAEKAELSKCMLLVSKEKIVGNSAFIRDN